MTTVRFGIRTPPCNQVSFMVGDSFEQLNAADYRMPAFEAYDFLLTRFQS